MSLAAIPLFPVSASEHAARVDYLFFGLLAISIGIALLLTFLILYCVVRYRAGSHADRTPMKISSNKIEIAWTIIPGLIFVGLFAWGAALYLDGDRPAKNSDTVYIVARQWMWEMRYSDGRREHNRLHVPIGRPVQLLMTSEDVIHSFYVPAMRMKQDVVPGKYVSLSFTPDRPGTYPLYCAEYCGTKHSEMIGEVTVMKADDYENWLAAGEQLPSFAAEGQSLFAERGCAGCHFPGASVHAPMLQGLYGKSIPLEDGSFILADAQYLRDSILLPLKQVAAGYDPVMPSYQGQLEESQVMALVEYIKSMKDQPVPRISAARPAPEGMRKEPAEQ